jgi:hypothetical protein
MLLLAGLQQHAHRLVLGKFVNCCADSFDTVSYLQMTFMVFTLTTVQVRAADGM